MSCAESIHHCGPATRQLNSVQRWHPCTAEMRARNRCTMCNHVQVLAVCMFNTQCACTKRPNNNTCQQHMANNCRNVPLNKRNIYHKLDFHAKKVGTAMLVPFSLNIGCISLIVTQLGNIIVQFWSISVKMLTRFIKPNIQDVFFRWFHLGVCNKSFFL